MSIIKAKQYREMALPELVGKVEELEKQLFELRCQAVTEKLANGKAIRTTRREIARVKTVVQEKRG
jgi:large subunit ribosomal protein L29